MAYLGLESGGVGHPPMNIENESQPEYIIKPIFKVSPKEIADHMGTNYYDDHVWLGDFTVRLIRTYTIPSEYSSFRARIEQDLEPEEDLSQSAVIFGKEHVTFVWKEYKRDWNDRANNFPNRYSLGYITFNKQPYGQLGYSKTKIDLRNQSVEEIAESGDDKINPEILEAALVVNYSRVIG